MDKLTNLVRLNSVLGANMVHLAALFGMDRLGFSGFSIVVNYWLGVDCCLLLWEQKEAPFSKKILVIMGSQ